MIKATPCYRAWVTLPPRSRYRGENGAGGRGGGEEEGHLTVPCPDSMLTPETNMTSQGVLARRATKAEDGDAYGDAL